MKSVWRAPYTTPEIECRLARFQKKFRRLFQRRKARSNLRPLELNTLNDLRADDSTIIANSDKGLGPVGVKIARYIRDGLKHLTNSRTYKILTETEALEDARNLSREIFDWTVRWRRTISKSKLDFICKKLEEAEEDPFGYFYLLYKLHKSPISTRPVCSDCASLTHSLGQWIDEQLQPIVQRQHTYFRDSFVLKRNLKDIAVPPNASLFTYDAVSMYTNIDTDDCLERLSTYLRSDSCKQEYPHLRVEALIEALALVMRNNRHDDPAVDALLWKAFQAAVNNGGLCWEFTERSRSVNFMDVTIYIEKGRLETNLFEKKLALHLYLPPHSCHSP
ncbi:hypothetical protein ACHAWF_011720, partial [Thalassiosira exigua]